MHQLEVLVGARFELADLDEDVGRFAVALLRECGHFGHGLVDAVHVAIGFLDGGALLFNAISPTVNGIALSVAGPLIALFTLASARSRAEAAIACAVMCLVLLFAPAPPEQSRILTQLTVFQNMALALDFNLRSALVHIEQLAQVGMPMGADLPIVDAAAQRDGFTVQQVRAEPVLLFTVKLEHRN